MGNIVETTGTFLTSGKGTNIFGRGPNSERRQDIKAEEEKMVDEINKLKIDPSTGLPVLASLEDDKEMALSDKEDAISGLSKKATSQQDKMFADLYKQGVTTHGKFTGLQKDLSEGFSTDVSKVMSDFSEDTGSIEDKALSDLATIRQSIVDTENLMKDYRTHAQNIEIELGMLKERILKLEKIADEEEKSWEAIHPTS